MRASSTSKHDHLEFALDDASRLVYNDPRRFGMVRLISRADLAVIAELKAHRPEPLSADFNADYLRGSRRAEKKSRSRTSSWISGSSPE